MPNADTRVNRVQRRPHSQNIRRAVNENVPREQRQRQALRSSANLTPSKRWALIISLMVLFISMGVLIYVGDLVERKYSLKMYNYLNDKGMNSSAKILAKLTDDCERLRLVELHFLSISDIGALVSVIKEKLQPIQSRVTSLISQTSKYEQMNLSKDEKPQQFISTVLKELNDLEERLATEYDAEVHEILVKDAALTSQMMSAYTSHVEEGSFFLDVMTDENLMIDKIHIVPPPEIDAIDGGKYIDNLIIKHDFDEVITVVRNLIPWLQKRDDLWDQVEDMHKRLGIMDKSNIGQILQASMDHPDKFTELEGAAEHLEYMLELCIDYVNENGTIIQLLLPHQSIAVNRVADLAGKFHEYDFSRRQGYLSLRKSLETSIDRLRQRIQKF